MRVQFAHARHGRPSQIEAAMIEFDASPPMIAVAGQAVIRARLPSINACAAAVVRRPRDAYRHRAAGC
jgi:hypothetical protein